MKTLFFLIIKAILCYFSVKSSENFARDNENNYSNHLFNFVNEEKCINEYSNLIKNNIKIGRNSIINAIIFKNWFNFAKLLTKYFIQKNVDLYDTFLRARKSLKIKFLKHFENLVALLPNESERLNM